MKPHRFRLVSLIVVMTLAASGGRRTPAAEARTAGAAAGQTGTLLPLKAYLPIVGKNDLNFSGPDIPFGYGWNVADFASFQPASGRPPYPPTTFNWLKVTNEPEEPAWLCNEFRLSYNVLLRLNYARASNNAAAVGGNAGYWAAELHKHNGDEKCVEAFEIGNEPNLVDGYGGTIDPVNYADQLCAAYAAIKAVDDSYIVVSAGLAPTGGNDARYAVDEELFTRRMLDRIRAVEGSAEACFDVFGYHNFGFRTGYSTDPYSANCPDGMCFRGVERIRAILVEYGVNRRLWTTEFGWMRDFVAGGCSGAPWASIFGGFPVSDQAQADNLVNTFQYARANWPWMGAMFVFNLDFNVAPWYGLCETESTWFGVKGYPAEAALEAMPTP